MSFQTPITIANAVEDINNRRLLLPAIQREFVWRDRQIEWLFDSILRRYPIGSFLFWRVEGRTKTQYKFYTFLKAFRERYQTHNEEFNTNGAKDFMAVLDGQQRLAAIYIGLMGTYAYKLPRRWWENTEYSIPTRHLYLNIAHGLKDEEDGREYDFRFLTDAEYESQMQQWFRVSVILGLRNLFEFNTFLNNPKYKDNRFAWEALSRLQEAVHTDRVINFFLEEEQSLDKALNIFIRINSGGEPLDFSDLLMSIAVANWTKRDARKEINELLDEIRDKGFFITKDLVLKTFLVLYSADIKFKVTNFSTKNAKLFESQWDSIRSALLEAFQLIKSFGFTDKTLTSKNAVIPIIYYLYHRNIATDFCKKKIYEKDREIIRKWLHVVLIKRIFGGHADTILSKIRTVFSKTFSKTKLEDVSPEFPHQAIAKSLRGTEKGIEFDDEYIDNLLLTQKDDPLCFSILAVFYPNLDYRNGDFHKDHVFAETYFSEKRLKELGIREDQMEFYLNPQNYNSVLNLQLLDAVENKSKKDADLKSWVEKESKAKRLTVQAFCARHVLPEIFHISEFEAFISNRRGMLTEILKALK